MAISILLADDHHIVRQALRILLETQPDFNVVGKTGDGLQVAPSVEQLRPDVLLLDLAMPHLNGLEVTRQVHNRSPKTRVLILSMYANEAYVQEALANGASGYILKDSTASELVRAVREVAAGRHYLSPPYSERAFESYIERAKKIPPDVYHMLTPRQREVLHLVAEGCTNHDIAALLSVSPRTVESHRASLMRKLGVRTQAELVRYAIERGILPQSEMQGTKEGEM